MNYWRVLGIRPTKDKMAIKEACMEKLSQINPEDDEEGFKEAFCFTYKSSLSGNT